MSKSATAAKDILFSTPNDGGVFKRAAAAFRSFIAKDSKEFPPQANRYHLYLSEACPWCHRTDMMLSLKGLRSVVSVSYVDAKLVQTTGWTFSTAFPDHVNGRNNVGEIYLESDPKYEGKKTVPILYDKQNKRIVSNESSEIIRMFNTEFNDLAQRPELDFYPQALRKDIDEINDWVYKDFNNGVYQSGFATSQDAYEEAATRVFQAADKLDALLAKSKFLVGDQFTEADIRAFPTALRFNPVYHFHFKLNKKDMTAYPNIWRWMKLVYNTEGVKETIYMDKIVEHYYWSHNQINPYRIIPQLTSVTDLLEEK